MNSTVFTQATFEDLQNLINTAVQQALSQSDVKKETPETNELISRKQAAKLLGISLPTLHEYTKRGLIPAYRIGSQIRFKKGEVLECLRKVQTKKHNA